MSVDLELDDPVVLVPLYRAMVRRIAVDLWLVVYSDVLEGDQLLF